ncbi:hypothetical protein ACFSOV_18005 [Pedobacter petrophilus]
MSQAAETLISLLLPEGILDYFELTKVDKEGKMLNIYLQEKNIAPDGHQHQDLE